MNAITLGPLVLSGERFAIIAGVFVFMIGAGLLASRVSPRFNLWSTVLVFGGLVEAHDLRPDLFPAPRRSRRAPAEARAS